MNTAIAQHLNVAESAIVEIQEWARVLWVRVKGLGARFVSKKVVENMAVETVYERQLSNGDWVVAELMHYIKGLCNVGKLTEQEVISKLAKGETLYWDYDWSDKVRLQPAAKAFQPPAKQMMKTSTGQWVSADEWDEIEGAM